jgi:hypothetical protein
MGTEGEPGTEKGATEMTIELTKMSAQRPTEVGTDGCRLFLIGHGTTMMNVENRYRGRCDVPLDAQRDQDAVDAARQLSSVDLTAVYSNPLRRVIATAQIIADEARVPDMRILPTCRRATMSTDATALHADDGQATAGAW